MQAYFFQQLFKQEAQLSQTDYARSMLLEISLRYSRSLKMAPSDRSYRSAIVSIAVSCAVFELFDIEEYRDLET